MRRRNAATERVRSSSRRRGGGDGQTAAVRAARRRALGRGVGSMILAARRGQRRARRRRGDAARAASSPGGRGGAAGAAAGAGAAAAAATPTLRGNVAAAGRGGLAAGEATARLFFGLALELGFLRRGARLPRALRASAASRSARSRASRSRADCGLGLLAAAVLLFARARVGERAGARLALLLGQGAQDDAGLGRRDAARGGGRPGARRDGRGAAGAAAARPRRGGGRRGRARGRLARSDDAALHLLDHHRLAAAVGKALAHRALLDRALQMQRRLRRRGAQSLVAAVVRFAHASFPKSRLVVGLIERTGLRPRRRRREAAAGVEAVASPVRYCVKTLRLREKGRAGLARDERCMYHICPPQCQIQLARGEEIDPRRPAQPRLRGRAAGRSSLCGPVGRAVAGVDEADDLARGDRRLDLGAPARPGPPC